MSSHNNNLFRSTSNHCFTPRNVYIKETEDVYKLNFFNIENYSSKKQKGKKNFELKPIESIQTSELFLSIEKVKKFLPNIVNLINITESKKTESKLFKRLEHQEYEKSYKNELKIITEKREEIKKILFEKRKNIQKLENQLSDIELSLKVFNNLKNNNALNSKNEIKKKVGQRYSIIQVATPQSILLQNKLNKDGNITNSKNNIKNLLNSKIFKNYKIQRKSCIIKTEKILNNNEEIKLPDTNISPEPSKGKQGEKIAKLHSEFSKIKSEKNELYSEIKILEKEKEDLKKKREKIVEHLYLYYLDILKEGNDTRNEGLVWIVKEILNLGKIVLISYFPKYLSESEILYIFNQAKLKILLEEYENKIQKLRKELVDLNLFTKSNKENNKINELNLKSYKYKDKNNNISKLRLKKESSDYLIKYIPKIVDKNINMISSYNSKKKTFNNYSKFNSTARTTFTNINNDNNFNFAEISFNSNNNDNINSTSNNLNNNNLKDNNKNIYVNINYNIVDPKLDKLSRNKFNYINKNGIDKKLLGIHSKKLDLSNISLIPNKLTLTEVKEFLNSKTSRINENNYGKIKEYFILNKKILKVKKISNEMKNKKIKAIFEKYNKKAYNRNFMLEKEKVLSSLIGEDNVLQELNKQSKELK